MAILFNRRETQLECENIARTQQGLANGDESFNFKNLTINLNDVSCLLPKCYADSIGFYFNALISFTNGLYSIKHKNYSWASVQLYYSIYYGCRAKLGFDKIAIIRKKGLFSLEISPNSVSQKLKDQNDHKMTINCYKRKYELSDFLLSNKINNVDFYDWITDIREITHYRQRSFQEPNYLGLFNLIVEELKNGKTLFTLLEEYSQNWNLFCFQEETAIIAGPYKLLFEVAQFYKNQPLRLDLQQRNFIKRALKKANCEKLFSNFI